MSGWPHFGWSWWWAIAAATVAMILAGFLPIKAFWARVATVMTVFVAVYLSVLLLLSYYGIGV